MENSTPIILVRQLHKAKRAGDHYDLRVVIGDKAYSWATKKEMPELGKPHIIFEQPIHDRKYALSKKVVIPPGQYGAGVTTLDFAQKGKASVTPDEYHLDLNNGERFFLKRLNEEKYGEKAWLFARKRTYKEKEELALKKQNKYLEKIAGPYEDMSSFRTNLRSEAKNIYDKDWDGRVPHKILLKAHQDVIDNTTVHEDGEVYAPDIQDYILTRMRNRHVNAGLEEAYGNDVVRRADSLAHNGASWKGLSAGLLGGVAGASAGTGVAKVLGSTPKIGSGFAIAGGIAGLAGAGYLAAKSALSKGETKADQYLANRYLTKAAARKNSATTDINIGIVSAGLGAIGGSAIQRGTTRALMNSRVERGLQRDALKFGPYMSKGYTDRLRLLTSTRDTFHKVGRGAGTALKMGGIGIGAGLVARGIAKSVTE